MPPSPDANADADDRANADEDADEADQLGDVDVAVIRMWMRAAMWMWIADAVRR
ncbi:MAG: hypothetical protein AAF962_25995 [Actinomycetota bacterium]